MRGPKPVNLHITIRQQEMLEQIVRRATSPQCEVMRAQIILAAAAGKNNQQIADRMGIDPQTVRTWRGRWAEAAERLEAIEAGDDEAALPEVVHELLRDDPRRGAPAKFTPEQICQLVAVSCEPPSASGRPVSHWTPDELADEVVKRGIVTSISPRSVGRFLKRRRPQTPSLPLLAQSSAG
jgi:transposase